MGSARLEPVSGRVDVRQLHVAQIGFFRDSQRRAPRELLEAWPSLVDVAEAAAAGGTRVSVIQACDYEDRLVRNGVHYHFLPFGHRHATRAGWRAFQDLLSHIGPDALHVHGLGFSGELRRLSRAAPALPILVQDHANRLPRFWRRPHWRRGLAVASGFAFCARGQAEPFVQASLIPERARLFEIPESTSRFGYGDRTEARRLTGLEGEPAVLWVGHLDENKDPLSVLRGVSAATSRLPGLQLWCCFGKGALLADVHSCIEKDSRLSGRVRLLGCVPHERIELLMRAADLFVLGSHREGSGYSLIEALACGLPPAVTDIPSFRALTGNGIVGRLWPCGDSASLAEALVDLAMRPTHDLRRQVRRHFEAELSFPALGRKLATAYSAISAYAGR